MLFRSTISCPAHCACKNCFPNCDSFAAAIESTIIFPSDMPSDIPSVEVTLRQSDPPSSLPSQEPSAQPSGVPSNGTTSLILITNKPTRDREKQAPLLFLLGLTIRLLLPASMTREGRVLLRKFRLTLVQETRS